MKNSDKAIKIKLRIFQVNLSSEQKLLYNLIFNIYY